MAGFITPKPHPYYMDLLGRAGRVSADGTFQAVPNPPAGSWYTGEFGYQTTDMKDCRQPLKYGPISIGYQGGPLGEKGGKFVAGVGNSTIRIVAASSNQSHVKVGDAVFLWAGDAVLKQIQNDIGFGAPPGLPLTVESDSTKLKQGDFVYLRVANTDATQWQCIDNIPVPVRRNAAGDIECAANDGQNCLWKGDMAGCDTVLANPGTNPLACGVTHKNIYGGSGYAGNHWCNSARTYFNSRRLGIRQGVVTILSDAGGAKFRLGEAKCNVTNLQNLCGATCPGFVYAEAPAVWAPLSAASQFRAQKDGNVKVYSKIPAKATMVEPEVFAKAAMPVLKEGFRVPKVGEGASPTARAQLEDWGVVRTQYKARAIGWLSVLAIILASSTWIRSSPR